MHMKLQVLQFHETTSVLLGFEPNAAARSTYAQRDFSDMALKQFDACEHSPVRGNIFIYVTYVDTGGNTFHYTHINLEG